MRICFFFFFLLHKCLLLKLLRHLVLLAILAVTNLISGGRFYATVSHNVCDLVNVSTDCVVRKIHAI